jgi:hypothetical protein
MSLPRPRPIMMLTGPRSLAMPKECPEVHAHDPLEIAKAVVAAAPAK